MAKIGNCGILKEQRNKKEELGWPATTSEVGNDRKIGVFNKKKKKKARSNYYFDIFFFSVFNNFFLLLL